MLLGKLARALFGGFVVVVLNVPGCRSEQKRPAPVDPGVRGGAPGAGTPLNGLTADETVFFQDGQARFAQVEVVQNGPNIGLGPRFNSNQCLSCHAQPAPRRNQPAPLLC